MGLLARLGLASVSVLISVLPLWADDTPDEEIIQIRTPVVGIEIVAVNARLINEGVVDTTVVTTTTTGLNVVPVGLPVYVAASEGFKGYGVETAPSLIEGTNFDWSVTGPAGTTADIADAAQVGKQFTPDLEGDYVVTLVLTHADGDTTLNQTITASKFVGHDRCAQCHSSVKDSWAETGHAKMLQRGLSGTLSSHYNASCVKCHSVSANRSAGSAAVADNDGFEDVAAELGWVFPSDLNQGSWVQSDSPETPDALGIAGWNLDLEGEAWEDLPDELKALAGIQCETCHGPGAAHSDGGFSGDPGQKKIGVSLDNGVCAQCHDDGHYHVRPEEWESSGHSKLWSRNTASCANCHTGSGYLVALEEGLDGTEAGVFPASGSFELGVTQTCGTCHEPHSVANEHQVRKVGEVTIEAMVEGGGTTPQPVTFDMGTGAMCAQCHNMRAGKNTVDSSIHHSHQTEMILGVGGYHYDGESYPSSSHKHMDNACVTCHMSRPPSGGEGHLGSHSWNMVYDNGTPDDASDDIYNTTSCSSCHGPVENLDINGAQAEIHELVTVLADLLPIRSNGAFYTTDNGGYGSSPDPMTDTQLQASWNGAFVHDDGSSGAHNFSYSRKLLVDAIKSLQVEAPTATAGDFDGSGQVDFSDIFMFTSQFGKTSASSDWDPVYDLSENGVVGFTDWLMLVDIFGATTASTKPVSFVDSGVNTDARFAIYGSDMRSVDQEHIAVRLTVDDLTEMRGYAVGLEYDTDGLEFVRAIRAEDGLIASGNSVLTVMNTAPGKLTVSDAIVGDNGIRGDGDLVDVIFKLKGPASASSVTIDFTQLADLNYGINRPSYTETIGAGEAFAYSLGQNYPNPFNPATSIRYSVAAPGQVTIEVYNALGQKVRTLVENHKVAGEYTANWDARDLKGRDVASGVYIYRMNVNGFESAHRMVLVR
jgi:hypothetical protein